MIKRIPLESLEPGMFVSSFDLSWFKHPFVSTRLGVIRDRGLIDQLRQLGVKNVEVDTSLAMNKVQDGPAEPETPQAEPAAAPRPSTVCPPVSDLGRTVRFAKRLFDQAVNVTKAIMDSVSKGEAVPMDHVKPLVARMVDSVGANENVMHVLVSLKEYDDYTFTHSLNLAALSVLLGDSLDMDQKSLEVLGMAGILHDVGKCLLPRDLVVKPGPLTREEFERMKEHPALGFAHLSSQGGIPEKVLRCVLEHHERMDGTGYPRGLSGDAVDPMSSIVSVVDVYDALTSDRVYRSRMSPHAALRCLFNLRDKAFPSSLVDTFIKRLGVYPSLSVVQLKNGCYGIVTRQTPGRPLHPEVIVFCDREQRPVARRRVDTWRLGEEMSREEFIVDRPVEPGEVEVPSVMSLA